MNRVVIDASVVLRWAFRDEADREGASHVTAALEAGALDAVGPPNFLLEVAAALVLGVRNGRIGREDADRTFEVLARVSIPEHDAHAIAASAYRTALATGIRVPDAAYIETAARVDATLISADRAQLQAADERGLVAMPLSSVRALLP